MATFLLTLGLLLIVKLSHVQSANGQSIVTIGQFNMSFVSAGAI